MRARAAADSELIALRRESCGPRTAGTSPGKTRDAPPPGTAVTDIDTPRAERDIDTIDRRILRVLQADGRISNLKLAEAVHLSPTAVLERVKRLHRDGYILGYQARLNPEKLGAGLLVFVEVLLDRTVHDVMDSFRAAVQVRTEILEAHLVAGGFDYLLKTRVADMAAYREFIGSVIWTLPGVRETRTYVVMEEVKNSTALRL
ncbi:MAG: ArsR family transcriptional regulator [Leptothrix sp. (in: Bacteria)]|nr:ArsR family transcriptional regulator [Leptothrix sp. (in: b-proteobacteria)]